MAYFLKEAVLLMILATVLSVPRPSLFGKLIWKVLLILRFFVSLLSTPRQVSLFNVIFWKPKSDPFWDHFCFLCSIVNLTSLFKTTLFNLLVIFLANMGNIDDVMFFFFFLIINFFANLARTVINAPTLQELKQNLGCCLQVFFFLRTDCDLDNLTLKIIFF